MENASNSISEISLDVYKFVGRDSAFESMISKGEKVIENDMLSLIKLMNEVLKLNEIMGMKMSNYRGNCR
ncbi:unnamed protein product [Linum trigynum]|uniref:Uncharacterized protein n=1 Tax=Linum trigynum TaxID=586398 RepID=A0AAV2GNS6_9ROSI